MNMIAEKPHQCAFCDRRFRKREHLQRHTRTHTKEKPYTCQCGSSFARRDLLHRHERLAHSDPVNTRTESNRTPNLANHCEASSAESRRSPNTRPQTYIDAVELTVGTVEEQTEQDLVDSAAHRTLPLPPEYHYIASSFLDAPTEEDVLSQYNDFFLGSGLRKIAEGLRMAAIECDDVDENLDPNMITTTLYPDHPLTSPAAAILREPTTPSLNVLTSTNAPGSLWEEYLAKNTNFVPPSTQTCRRYFTAYHKNGRVPLVHPSIKPENLSFALRTAMLALGALYLFDDCKAKLLFEASKSVALDIWLNQPLDTRAPHFNAFSQLGSAFILLAEFVKIEQPLDLAEKLYVFQSSLQFCLRAGTGHNDDAPSVAAEMARRTSSFGYCTLVSQSLLLGFPVISLPDDSCHLRLPCPQTLWERADESPEQLDSTHPGDFAISYFSNFRQQTGAEEVIPNPAPEKILLMTAIATHRVQLAREASRLTKSDDILCSEYIQFARVASLLSKMVHTTQEIADGSVSCNLLQDLESLVHIENMRMCLSTSGSSVGLFNTKDPVQLAETLQDYSLGSTVPMDSVLPIVDVSIGMLESPANTGFAFFVRLEASRWALETVLSVFESALFLSQWVLQISGEESLCEASRTLFERVQSAIAMAWSSLDDVGDVMTRGNSKSLAWSILTFWGRVLEALETKPFARLLGRTLAVRSQSLIDLVTR
ncbi:hypothetical protein C7974DRAFT_407170 [Boeremia exigua]|uniref:uncharacterized protein n=1 Tax=Boeremia exigua TaxID=749465 RepID=UPI001E8CFC50|nr:uncharacterized protein C7974DRAFT_407170 [Boeremia exigua]KAH6612176.1 hypothetical protein C7974DRAFT_407170 [Boeremia exigua]